MAGGIEQKEGGLRGSDSRHAAQVMDLIMDSNTAPSTTQSSHSCGRLMPPTMYRSHRTRPWRFKIIDNLHAPSTAPLTLASLCLVVSTHRPTTPLVGSPEAATTAAGMATAAEPRAAERRLDWLKGAVRMGRRRARVGGSWGTIQRSGEENGERRRKEEKERE